MDPPSMNFKIEKRIKLVKTICLSTLINIFDQKNFSNFFCEWGGVKKSFILFNDEKLPENICDIEFAEKCSIRGLLTFFCRKAPFWGPY